MFFLAAIVSQDAEEDLTMTVPKMAVPEPSPESISSPDSSKVLISPKLIPDFKKKLVQQSMFGKPLPHFKPKVRVCSYKKNYAILVKKCT